MTNEELVKFILDRIDEGGWNINFNTTTSIYGTVLIYNQKGKVICIERVAEKKLTPDNRGFFGGNYKISLEESGKRPEVFRGGEKDFKFLFDKLVEILDNRTKINLSDWRWCMEDLGYVLEVSIGLTLFFSFVAGFILLYFSNRDWIDRFSTVFQ